MGHGTIGITESVIVSIESLARNAHPAECCGLLSGSDGIVTHAHPLLNTASEPQNRYFAAPEDLFAAMRVIRESGRSFIGIYHSHPRTPAYPSPVDVEMAFYPDALYFIMAIEPRVDLKAYRIVDSTIETVSVLVVGSGGKDGEA